VAELKAVKDKLSCDYRLFKNRQNWFVFLIVALCLLTFLALVPLIIGRDGLIRVQFAADFDLYDEESPGANYTYQSIAFYFAPNPGFLRSWSQENVFYEQILNRTSGVQMLYENVSSIYRVEQNLDDVSSIAGLTLRFRFPAKTRLLAVTVNATSDTSGAAFFQRYLPNREFDQLAEVKMWETCKLVIEGGGYAYNSTVRTPWLPYAEYTANHTYLNTSTYYSPLTLEEFFSTWIR